MPATPRKHHYVTRAYLKKFLQPAQSLLFCYGRKKDKFFRAAPENLAHVRDYYSFKGSTGSDYPILENLIANNVETPALPVIENLAGGHRRLKWQQRGALTFFIALQRFRVPYEREFMDQHRKESVAEMLEAYRRAEQKSGGRTGVLQMAVRPLNIPPPPDKWTSITKEELEAELQSITDDPEGFSRWNCIEMAQEFSMVFRHMKWTVHYAHGRERYITSDCPVVMRFANPDFAPAGLMRKDCEILFPLSSAALLLMRHDHKLNEQLIKTRHSKRAVKMLKRLPEIGFALADDNEVMRFNEQQADHAYRWVFSGRALPWLPDRLKRRSRNIRQVFVRTGNGFEMHYVTAES
jgi:hypothetical protein